MVNICLPHRANISQVDNNCIHLSQIEGLRWISLSLSLSPSPSLLCVRVCASWLSRHTLSHSAHSTVSVSFILFSLLFLSLYPSVSHTHTLFLLPPSLSPCNSLSHPSALLPISLSVRGLQEPQGPPGVIGQDGPKVCVFTVIISYYANRLLFPGHWALLLLF